MSTGKIEGFGKLLNKAANLLLLASMLGASGMAIAASIDAGLEWWRVGFVVCALLFAWAMFFSWLKTTGEKQGLI